MQLKIKKDNKDYATISLLEEKLGGVELPYLHVKKDGKTYYLPMVKNNAPKWASKKIFKVMYNGEKYSTLNCESIKDIGVITLVDGKIHQSRDFRMGYIIFFNKAKRLSLYTTEENFKKLMDINYDDVITLFYIPRQNGFIVNLTTGETVYGGRSYRHLEFREE